MFAGFRSMSILYLALLTSLLSGCAVQKVQVDSDTESVEHHVKRDFVLGEQKTVHVGEPLFKVKDYYIKKTELPVLCPLEDTSIYMQTLVGKKLWGSFKADEKIEIINKIVYDDDYYHTIGSRHKHSINMMISEQTGELFKGGYVFNQHSYTNFSIKSEPENPVFYRAKKESVDVAQGYVNYEIIYNGMDDKQLFLMYREFSPDNLARTAFFQNLNYSRESTTIRFKNIKIKVHSANNEEIVFTVVEI